MQEKKKSRKLPIIMAFLAGMVVTFGIMAAVSFGFGGGPVLISQKTYDYYKELDDRFSKLNALYDEVSESYYQEPDAENLANGMYKGLIAGLGDPYSAYMTEEEYESWSASVTGEFEGIGITFTTNADGEYIIVSTIGDSPAEKAGLKAGDILVSADGKTYDNMDNFSTALRGEAGTKVKVGYIRDGKQNEVTITRAKIINETVESKILDDNIGYISISGFEEHTAEDFLEELDAMEAKKVDGLIIDVRDNGGGLVTVGTEIADALMGESTITYMEDRNGEKQYLKSDAEETSLPYVLLVNENSASMSEILAAAVKDNTDNPLVGTTTFGKGVVQTSGQLDDGSALTLTVMQYFSPEGTVIHKKGVEPDYEVENTGDKDLQLEKAIELLSK